MTDTDNEDGFWNKISSINRVECGNCGHGNSRGVTVCEQCQSPLPGEEEEEETVNAMVGEELAAAPKLRKVLLKDAKNLINLKRAVEGVESGTMSKDDYRQIVKKLHSLTAKGVALCKADVIKKKVAKLPEEEQKLVADTSEQIFRYHDAITLMMKYLESSDIIDAKAGLAMAEDALTKMDLLQDKAIDIAAAL
jgi:hypothetical protein